MVAKAVLVVLMATPLMVHATPAGNPPAFERAAALREARAHFDIGLRHYNLGEFDRAIVEFKLAYRRSEAPGLLFNIAQAHRARGDFRSALHFYAAYLREAPRASERAYVERRMMELEKQLHPAPKPEPAPLPAATPAPEPEPEVTVAKATPEPEPVPSVLAEAAILTEAPRARETGRSMKVAGIVTATAGAAAIVAGAYFSIQAEAASDEVANVFKNGGRWSKRHDELVADGERSEIAAAVLYAVGGAAVVTGGVLYWFGARREAAAPRFTVGSLRGGGMRVGMRWGF